jgi:hypothetical protein
MTRSVRSLRAAFLVCTVALLAVLSVRVSAADPPASPTYVDCLVSLISLSKLNGVEQSFSADFYLTIIWEDPSLNATTLTYDPATNWNPKVEFTNVLATPEQSIDEPYSVSATAPRDIASIVSPTATGPWVIGQLRYKGQFVVDMNLRDFPFDRQSVKLKLESALYPIEQVVFRVAPGNWKKDSVLPSKFSVVEWSVLSAEAEIRSVWYPVFQQTYSQFRVDVLVERDPGYYITKFVVGVAMLVVMGFMVFALEIDEADRMMGTLSVFLGIISFLFIASQDLPKVAYQTRIDSFMSLSFSVVFVIMLVHSLNYLVFWKLNLREEHLEAKINIKEKEEEAGEVSEISPSAVTDASGSDAPSVAPSPYNGQLPPLKNVAPAKADPKADSGAVNHEFDDVEQNTDSAVSYALKTLLQMYGIKKKKHRITRFADVTAIIALAIVYTIATAVILRGKETSNPSSD